MESVTSQEAPETPAHVFAFRAFKTAIFGTPAIVQETALFKESIDDGDDDNDNNDIDYDNNDDDDDVPAKIQESKKPSEADSPIQPPRGEPTMAVSSPMKSILLTPGTIAPFRKTVTFSGVRDDTHAPGDDGNKGKSQLRQALSSKSAAQHNDAVRRSLFRTHNNQQGQAAELAPAVEAQKPASLPGQDTVDEPSSLTQADYPVSEADITIDLRRPKSSSGKHWKNEYQREHDKTKVEMKRLIRYSQVAKSYAAKRDGDACRLREKLEEAESKVQQLEEKVVQLASDLGKFRLEDQAHAELISNLAIQTANAVKYKQKAARYRTALQEEGRLSADDSDGNSLPAKKASSSEPEQVAVSLLNDERSTHLEQQNATLRQTIIRVKEEMGRYEERHRKWQENRRRRDERWASKCKGLEESLEQSRKENQKLRKELEVTNRSTETAKRSRAEKFEVESVVNQPKASPQRIATARQPLISRVQGVRHASDPSLSRRTLQENICPHPGAERQLSSGAVADHVKTTVRMAETLRERPRSEHLREIANVSNRVQQEESLDLLSLGKPSINRNTVTQRRAPPLEEVDKDPGKIHAISTTDGPPIANIGLWDNLKRRTSLSVLGSEHGAPLGRHKYGMDGANEKHQSYDGGLFDKENVEPLEDLEQ